MRQKACELYRLRFVRTCNSTIGKRRDGASLASRGLFFLQHAARVRTMIILSFESVRFWLCASIIRVVRAHLCEKSPKLEVSLVDCTTDTTTARIDYGENTRKYQRLVEM